MGVVAALLVARMPCTLRRSSFGAIALPLEAGYCHSGLCAFFAAFAVVLFLPQSAQWKKRKENKTLAY